MFLPENPNSDIFFSYFLKIYILRFLKNQEQTQKNQMIHAGGGFFGSYIDNRIPWIHDPCRFFTSDQKRMNIPSGNSKHFVILHPL